MQAKKDECIIALDVGGTSLKGSLINLNYLNNLIVKECFHRKMIDSNGSAKIIIKTFVKAIKTAFQKALLSNLKVVGIGVSMPGPFNYEEGISLMEHKFKAIYGVNLRKEFARHLNLKESFPIKFTMDALAFLVGEAYFGAAKDYSRVIGITLGSGIGSAFMINRQIVLKGKGIPPNGALWPLPYKDGIAEDKISQRFIIKRYKESGGSSSSDLDVDKVSSLALKGDEISLKVFEELGSELGEVLGPIALEFKANCIVFGGGISKSFSLFAKPLKERLRFIPSLEKVVPTKLGDLSALYGLANEFTTWQKNY